MFDFMRLTTFMLASAEEGAEHAEQAVHHAHMNVLGLIVYVLAVAGVAIALMASAKKGLNKRFFTKRITQYSEQLYIFIENLCVGIIGAHGRKYMPMVMTFWIMIFFSNLVALAFPTSPTADLSFNLGMALIAIGYVQYEGMRANGVIGHFSHFAGPKMGLALIPINGMIFIIEIISEAMKNVSLSLRLYGNIDGGHKAAEAMNLLGGGIIPVGAFLMPIKLLTCVVQALIFCLLFCVYLSLVTHHEHDHEHGADHEHAHADNDPLPATA